MINSNSKLQTILRRSCRLVALTLCISLGAISENRQAQDQSPSVFESLHRSTVQLTQNTQRLEFQGVEAETVKRWLTSIESNVLFLEEIIHAQPNTRIPREYAASLKRDARLLENLTRLVTPSTASRRSIYVGLGDVALDLDIKVTYAKSALSAGFRLVQVVVHTIKENKEIGGYQVWYVPKGWADVKDEAKPFDRLSSPTYMNLPPGNYLMWTHKGGTISKRQPVSIGDDGRSRRELDLPID